MKTSLVTALAGLVVTLSLASPAWAKREANDPRKLCREAIQKANGLGKDAKVSRKEIDRCISNGGKP